MPLQPDYLCCLLKFFYQTCNAPHSNSNIIDWSAQLMILSNTVSERSPTCSLRRVTIQSFQSYLTLPWMEQRVAMVRIRMTMNDFYTPPPTQLFLFVRIGMMGHYVRLMCARIFVCIFVFMSVCMHVCTHVCLCARIFVCIFVCIYVYKYVCIYVCMYVCMYVCIYGRDKEEMMTEVKLLSLPCNRLIGAPTSPIHDLINLIIF